LIQLARSGTAFLIGQGLLSIVFLILAEFNQLTPFHIVLILLAGFGIGIWPLYKIISKSSIKDFFSLFRKSDHKNDKVFIWLAICVLTFSLMYSTARLSYDSVALYFSNSKIIALTGHIQYFLNDSFFVSSLQTGVNYAALIQIFGDQASRLYSWVNGIIIIIFSLAIGEEIGLSRRTTVIILALILTSTAFLDLMGDGKIDLASSAPAMAATYWMIISNKKPFPIFYLLVGLLAGLAMISRPFNIFLLAVFIGLYYLQLAYLQYKKNKAWNLRHLFQLTLWISVGVISLIVYHIIANWVITGDPLTPLKDLRNTNASDWQWALDPNRLWIIRLLYPLAMTYLNTPQSLGNISPLFVALLPGVLIKDFRQKIRISENLIVLVIAALITLLLWILLFFTIFEIRYVLFLWIILLIPAAVIIESILESQDLFFKTITNISLVALLSFIIVRTVYVSLDTYSPLDKQGNPQCYDFPFCDFLKPVNQTAPPGARVLTLNAFRYYLRTDLFACSTEHDEYQILQNLSLDDSTAFWVEVYRDGYKYIAYESNYSVRHLRLGLIPNPYNTPPWLTLKPIYGAPGNPEVAYEIQANNPPIQVEETCQKTNEGIWEIQTISNSGK
jgi:hypothetical protein